MRQRKISTRTYTGETLTAHSPPGPAASTITSTPLVWLVSELLTDPKHFFRSFTVKELGRLMTARPADLATRPRAHGMRIYMRYFDLIASGRKTTEI